MRGINRKVRNCKGESIAETLIALLVSSLALLMLAGAVTTATRVINQSTQKTNEYYRGDGALFGASGSPLTLTISTSDSMPAQVYEYVYNENAAFSHTPVIAYTKKD